MAEQDAQPTGTTPEPTGGTTAPTVATPDNNGGDGNPAGGQPDNNGQVVLSQEDYRNLVSQRDQNHANASSLEDTVAQLAMTQAIGELQQKYPGVPKAMLENASGYEAAEEIAKAWQSDRETAKQDALKDLQTVDQDDLLSEEDAASELKKLEGTGRLRDVLEIEARTKRS